MAAQSFLNQSFFIYNHALLKRNRISVRLKSGAATGRAYNNRDDHCLTSQIERIADKRMDEISREKEEYFADGVLWSDNHSNTSSDTKTVFERITCGSELDLARACDPISIECRERFRQRLRRIIHRLSDLVRANPFSKEAESSTNAPLSTNFWIVLSKVEVDEVFNILYLTSLIKSRQLWESQRLQSMVYWHFPTKQTTT